MVRIAYIIILFFAANTVFAQKNQLLKDSLSLPSTSKEGMDMLAPAKAAFLSTVLPGLGQAYNKKYWKMPIVYIGLGTSTYFIVSNQKKYNQFRNEYKKRLNGTANPNDPYFSKLANDRLIAGQKFYQRNRDLSVLVTAGIYILNIIDANVDAHLKQFNVDNQLSIKPEISRNEWTQQQQLGMTIQYHF